MAGGSVTKTGIGWTDEVWNPVTGCTRVSAGCDHCYAFQLHDQRYAAQLRAARAISPERAFIPPKLAIELAREDQPGSLPFPAQYDVPFSTVQLHEDRLVVPLAWKRPRRVFVNSMSDLFHEDVPDEFIDRVFAVMVLTPHITYQVLTKRPDRMRAYVASRGPHGEPHGIGAAMYALRPEVFDGDSTNIVWPLPNVWLGTSAEDQAAWDARVAELKATPAAVRFVSVEPMLGPIEADECCDLPYIDWVIVGGESGPRARTMELAGLRSLVEQCRAAGVAVYVKQDSGSRSGRQGRIPDDLWVHEFPEARS